MCGHLITSPLLISSFYQLYYNVIRLIGLKITLTLCLLLSFLHNRIPCKHNTWAVDNLALLDMLYLSFIQIISLTSSKITLALLLIPCMLFVKMETNFYLEKIWSGQNRSSQTVLPALTYLPTINTILLNDIQELFNQTYNNSYDKAR